MKGTTGEGIFLPSNNNLQIYGFCYSNWSACPLFRKSLAGYFITLDRAPLSWKTKKQATVSRSSAEAEYGAMAVATNELIWIRNLLDSLVISVNHAWVFLIILDLKVEINLHLFAFYPQFLRLRSVLALLSFLADLRVSSQVL